MSVEELFFTLVVYVILAIIVMAANYADQERHAPMRTAVFIALGLLNALIVLNSVVTLAAAYEPELASGVDAPGKASAIVAFIASVLLAGVTTALFSRRVRETTTVLFPDYQGDTTPHQQPDINRETNGGGAVSPELQPKPEDTPLFPQMLNYYTTEAMAVPRPSAEEPTPPPTRSTESGEGYQVRGFNTRSTVHMVALIFCLYLLGMQLVSFVLGGGLEGVAEDFAGGLSALDLIANGLPQVIIPLLGVGIGLRRSWSQTLKRLGLERPSLEGVGVAIAITFALLMFVGLVVGIWQAVVPEDIFEEQTEASDALTANIDTLGMALLLATSAAVGEEIAFRGALQPVFGFWPTAVLFALTHLQYTLTPASAIILVVAVAFGWIRQRYNTTVAILTHFLYNFIPLALSILYSEEALLNLIL